MWADLDERAVKKKKENQSGPTLLLLPSREGSYDRVPCAVTPPHSQSTSFTHLVERMWNDIKSVAATRRLSVGNKKLISRTPLL